jgi:hypothetical protein
MLERSILRIKNNSVYQELKSYYSQSTIFSALGIERNENRHSAFLCWLLDPKSDHQLGVEPLKKFLALYAANNKNLDIELIAAFITGRYELENIQLEKELTLARFCDEVDAINLDEKQKRLDIWAEFSVVLPDNNDSRTIALVLENKIYSKEGKKGDMFQTEVYHNCLSKYYEGNTLLEVFLTPDAEDGAHCPSFVHLTYQQLLDDVLLPLSSIAKSQHAMLFINDYIRNLGKPALNDENGQKKVKTYSILATSELEKKRLQQLLEIEGMKTIVEKALVAAYGDQAKDIVGKEAMKRNENMTPYETAVLTEFWNDNTDILKAMLHNLELFPDSKKEAIDKIFKESNRDTTKYVVERQAGPQWVFADKKYNRPLAKGRAACVFFAQWMNMHEGEFSLDDVRNAFPLSINKYYESSKWDFIDTLIFGSETDSLMANVINKAGIKKDLASDKWDFYPITIGKQKCGWGYVADGNMAVMPKMWRKEDFQRLLDHIDAHPELFHGLRIRQV